MHIVNKSALFIIDITKHIHIGYRCTHNYRFCLVFLDEKIFALHLLGFLKSQFGTQGNHPIDEHIAQLLDISIKNLTDFLDKLGILFGRNFAGATAEAILDVILQAHFVLSFFDGIGGNRQGACAERINLADELDYGSSHRHIGKRTEELPSPTCHISSEEKARIEFVCKTNPRIGFVIF